jgi:triosephosphate isomerase (TIM)
MTRRPVVAGNWKMNLGPAQAVKLSQTISNDYDEDMDGTDIILCPPFIDLAAVSNVLEFDRSPLELGAQNVYELMPEGTAAATGEISVAMLEEVGCAYCIIGHSERRQGFGETDALINQKARLLVGRGIKPIICCGETAEVNEAGETEAFVSAQIETALKGLPADKVLSSILAYEPIWAIGTGKTPTPEFADGVCRAIRAVVARLFGDATAAAIRILYGGSVKPGNAALFFKMPHIDGGLIGGAALSADDFIAIIEAAK